MKIAVLHWHTSSVGGIATTLSNYGIVASRLKDTFHILASDNQKTKKVLVLPEKKRVRGGDSFIDIDGYAPHHLSNFKDSAKFINTNYDVVMTSFICPHPTKAYGEEPAFLNLLKALKLPIVGYIHDAYWDSYREFGELTLPLCDKVFICQKAYGDVLLGRGYSIEVAYPPFEPIPVKKAPRDPGRIIWLPQWKNIKGVRPFFKGVPFLTKAGYRVLMYNNGIEYYKMRLEPEWRRIVSKDHFAPDYSGKGGAEFFGSRPLPEVMQALSESSFSIDFQGHAAKYEAYKNGSYNHTHLESIYYGACPVVHRNLLKSGVPAELVLPVEDLSKYPGIIEDYSRSSKYPIKKAREYVLDNFSAERQYERIFKEYRK